jgi:hypothetical protein
MYVWHVAAGRRRVEIDRPLVTHTRARRSLATYVPSLNYAGSIIVHACSLALYHTLTQWYMWVSIVEMRMFCVQYERDALLQYDSA